MYFYPRAQSLQDAAGGRHCNTDFIVSWWNPTEAHKPLSVSNSLFSGLHCTHLERSFEDILFTNCIKTPTQMSLWVPQRMLYLKCLDCCYLTDRGQVAHFQPLFLLAGSSPQLLNSFRGSKQGWLLPNGLQRSGFNLAAGHQPVLLPLPRASGESLPLGVTGLALIRNDGQLGIYFKWPSLKD